MLGIVKKWFGPKPNPIGVDFGSDSLKLAQVALIDKEWRLVAAASTDIPDHVRHEPIARMSFLVQATRDLLAQGGFTGRNAVVALPAASMFFQHLRLPKMDDDALKKAIPWEARGKIPIDPNHALLRHHVAGTVYQDSEEKLEVIAMAASRDLVNQYLDVAAKARLEIVNLNVEPTAILDCFSHVYRRKPDADITNCYVDIGCSSTRAIIARGAGILFARSIPIGGNHLTQAVANALNLKFPDAKMLRARLCALQPQPDELHPTRELAPNPSTTLPPTPASEIDQAALAEQASREPLSKLVAELDLCRRYYEATFPTKPLDRLTFIGGEARHKNLCQFLAQELGLPAQVGDPLVRMGRVSNISPDSGIDRRLPQPNWAVAIGLSLGPVGPAAQLAQAA